MVEEVFDMKACIQAGEHQDADGWVFFGYNPG